MKRLPSFVLSLLIGFLQEAGAAPTLIDGIAALVKGQPILISEVEEAKASAGAELKRTQNLDPNMPEAEFKKRILDQLINEKVMHDELSRRGMAVEDQDIESAIVSIMKDNNVSSRTQFEQLLMGEGLTLSDYKKSLSRQIALSRFTAAIVKPQIRISDEDVARELRRLGVAAGPTTQKRYEIQIFSRSKSTTSASDMKGFLDDIRKRGFEEVTRSNSEGPGKEDGGTLGRFLLSELQSELQELIPKMKVGDLTPVQEGPQGYTLFRLKSILEEKLELTGSEADKIRERLMQEETARVFDRAIRDLRSKARIQVYL